VVVGTCHPSDGGKHKIGGSWSKLAWTKSETLIRAKRAGDVAQAVKYLPSKHKALSSHSITNHPQKTNKN
jgi:hypothetical protein